MVKEHLYSRIYYEEGFKTPKISLSINRDKQNHLTYLKNAIPISFFKPPRSFLLTLAAFPDQNNTVFSQVIVTMPSPRPTLRPTESDSVQLEPGNLQC